MANIVKTSRYPYFIVEYVSYAKQYPNGIMAIDASKASNLIKNNMKLRMGGTFHSKISTATLMKALQIKPATDLLKITDGLASCFPDDIGKKLTGIRFKESTQECSVLELTFEDLTKDEASNGCFGAGRTYRIWLGYSQMMQGAVAPKNKIQSIYPVFEGCVQVPQFDYNDSGITITLVIASYVYTKINKETPFDILNYSDGKYDDSGPKDIKYPVYTVKTFLEAAARYLGAVLQVSFNSQDKKVAENYKRTFGYDDAADSKITAVNFWLYLSVRLRRMWQDEQGNLFYVAIKEVLDFLKTNYKIDWYITSYGELFFGILTDPSIIKDKNRITKVFFHRPFLPGNIISDVTFLDGLDIFTNFKLQEPKKEEIIAPIQTTLDPLLKKYENTTDNDIQNATTDITSSVDTPDGVKVDANVKESTKNNIDSNGGNSNTAGSGKEYIDPYVDKLQNETLNKYNMIATISGAMGDPYTSIGDVYYFRGIDKHTGYFWIFEVEHNWKKDGIYTMELTGAKPTDEEVSPANLQEEALSIVLYNANNKQKEDIQGARTNIESSVETEGGNVSGNVETDTKIIVNTEGGE